jgi:aconitate hydratase
MVAAGLLAQNAVKRGLSVPAYVKTSLAPGSRVVTEYLKHSGLQDSLDALGFNLIGYGCATCIGNSGPITPEIAKAIIQNDLVASAVLSGNRNFEGRIHPQAQANYLASPPLVVAYALAGNIHTDLVHDPIGYDQQGKPVYLKEIWPSSQQVQEVITNHLTSDLFQSSYAGLYQANPEWNDLEGVTGALYPWNKQSTYLQEPPFFEGLSIESAIPDIVNAHVLALFGDSITTDHISPAGSIPVTSPAGIYLTNHGVSPQDFNSYGARRGNHEVMMRGTFANIRLKNLLLNNVEGGYTTYFPAGDQISIYDAAMRYQADSTPLIILAGKEYGSGSSRDWAAKGTALLGVRAVIAESYERIHRSNLVGMGVLPLQFKPGENVQSLNLSGKEKFSIRNLAQQLGVGGEITVEVNSDDGANSTIQVLCRLDTPFDYDTFQAGGILQLFLKNTFSLD